MTNNQNQIRISGSPTPAEVAAVLAVLATGSGGTDPETRNPRRASRWSDPQRNMRSSQRPRPGAWVASTWRQG